MSDYPYPKLRELGQLLANEFPDLEPEMGKVGGGKWFVESFECQPIFLSDHRTLWISEECLTDEDDGPDTAANSTTALKNLELDKELTDSFVRELLLSHRDGSTPERSAKILAKWGEWRLVDPNLTIRVSK